MWELSSIATVGHSFDMGSKDVTASNKVQPSAAANYAAKVNCKASSLWAETAARDVLRKKIENLTYKIKIFNKIQMTTKNENSYIYRFFGIVGALVNCLCIYSFFIIGHGVYIFSFHWTVNLMMILFLLLWSMVFIKLSDNLNYSLLILRINTFLFIYTAIIIYAFFFYDILKEGDLNKNFKGAISSIIIFFIIGLGLKLYSIREYGEKFKNTTFVVFTVVLIFMIVLFIYKYLFVLGILNINQLFMEVLFLSLGLIVSMLLRFINTREGMMIFSHRKG